MRSVLAARLGQLRRGLQHVCRDRQTMTTRHVGDALQQRRRRSLWAGRTQRPVQSGWQRVEPDDLLLDEGEIGRGIARDALHQGPHRIGHVARQKRRNVQSGDVAQGDREHHTDADLGESGESRVQRFLVLRHQAVHVLDGGDAVAEAFDGPDQRAGPDLRPAALAEIGGLRVQRPDIEGHVFQQALQQAVIRVEMRVDEARHDQLVGRVEDFRLRVQPLGQEWIARRYHRGDRVALHQHVAPGWQVDVARRIPNASAGDDQPGQGPVTPIMPRLEHDTDIRRHLVFIKLPKDQRGANRGRDVGTEAWITGRGQTTAGVPHRYAIPFYRESSMV